MIKNRVVGSAVTAIFIPLGVYFLIVRPDIWWTIYPITHRPLPYVGGIFFIWLGIIGLILLIRGK